MSSLNVFSVQEQTGERPNCSNTSGRDCIDISNRISQHNCQYLTYIIFSTKHYIGCGAALQCFNTYTIMQACPAHPTLPISHSVLFVRGRLNNNLFGPKGTPGTQNRETCQKKSCLHQAACFNFYSPSAFLFKQCYHRS